MSKSKAFYFYELVQIHVFVTVLHLMKNWFFWAGVSFIVGGIVSFALNLGATVYVSSEDLSGYAIGWVIVGIVLIAIGFIKKNTAEP